MSHLHKNSRSKERVLIIDELSMINLTVFAQLAEAAFVGGVFVVLGDEFQIPPIGENMDRWKDLPESDFLHDMCNGLCVKLRKFRRKEKIGESYAPGDFQHFANVGALYPQTGECEE